MQLGYQLQYRLSAATDSSIGRLFIRRLDSCDADTHPGSERGWRAMALTYNVASSVAQ
eukprot:SAG25_NODE_82_length_16576_cov_27.388602_9_plen_58_part_00